MKKIFNAHAAPPAVGPYSHAVQVGNLLFLSGQLPLDPQTGKLTGSDISAQTEQIFCNLRAVLTAAGYDFADVAKTTVFLADMNDFAAMNAVYARYFSADFPARSTVQAAKLPRDAKIEIELIAAK